MKENLFARTGNTKKKASKPEKTSVKLEGKEIETQISRLAEINAKIDSLKAEAAELTDTVKKTSIEQFVKLFKETNSYPGSFNIMAGNSSLMFVPTDRYITLTEERFNELNGIYPEIAEQNNVYKIDADLIENKNYGQVISDLIMGSKKIEEADKRKLISVETSYSIKKGSIRNLQNIINEIEKKKEDGEETPSMETVIADIQPVFQIKNVQG